MGYKCSFMDNEIYSAQDVNLRLSAMFTQGVVLCDSGSILEDLNKATSEIATHGIIGNSCNVIRASNGYKITEGVALMADGSAIIFDADGFAFGVEEGVYSYVYLKRNRPSNAIDIHITATAPEGEYVSLCEITTDGEILDRRSYSKLKIASVQESTLRDFSKVYYKSDGYSGDLVADSGNFSYIIVWSGEYRLTTKTVNLKPSGEKILSIADGEELCISMLDMAGMTRFKFFAKKKGTKIKTRIEHSDSSANYAINFSVI